MKAINILLVFLVFQVFIASSFSSPTTYSSYNISVYLNADKLIFEEISISFDSEVDSFNYFLLHPARYVEVSADNNKITCNIKYISLGTLISCPNIKAKTICIKATLFNLITGKENLYSYHDKFVISNIVKEFSLKVYLPEGYVLASNTSLYSQSSYSPPWGEAKSDGRHIYIEWNTKPNLGDTYYIEVFFEKANTLLPSFSYYRYIPLFLLVLLFIFSVLFFLPRNKGVIAYLNENERKIIEVLKKHGKKTSQKKICIETDFSKAQVSRILKELEERGLVERRKKGRTYEVILKI